MKGQKSKIFIFILKFWPVIFIIFLWAVFSSPYLFQNKVPYPSSYQATFFPPWSAYEKFWGPVKNNAMPDIIDQIYPWRHLVIDLWKNLQLPLWNPYSFSGTPLLANYQSAVLSPFNVLFFILPFIDAWSLLILLQPLLAGIFMYLFIRSIKISKSGGLFSSISFMFCGFITSWMAYGTLGYAILFLPLSLFLIEKFYLTSKIRYLIIFSLTIPLSFFSGHFQTSIYFLLVLFLYLVFKLISQKTKINSFIVISYLLFGLLLSLPQILPSIELYSQSLRSGIVGATEVIPWTYLFTFIAPDFLGNPVTRNDWFGHYAEWNSYIGIIPLLFALFSFSNIKNKQTIFWFIISIFSILMAFNTPVLRFLIDARFPVLSTSAASRIIVLFSFSFAILAGFGFDKFAKDLKDKKFKNIIIWLMISFFFLLILWFVVAFKILIPQDKIQIAKSNIILPTVIFIINLFVIVLLLINKKMVPVVIAILLLTTAFDMFRFSSKWMPFDLKSSVFAEVQTTGFFRKLSGVDRAFGNYGGEVNIYYKLPSVEGYDALYIRRYGQFIASLSDGQVKDSARSVIALSKNGKYTPKAINLLGIRYIIHKIADDHAVWTFPYWTYPRGSFKLIYKDDKYEVYENLKVFPRAFLANSYKVVTDPQKIIDTMFSQSFDLSREIVLEKDPDLKLDINSSGEAEITKYSADRIDFKIKTDGNSILFLSDPYYTGWRAELDGKNVDILRADYAFRAIPVESGAHEVSLIYFPSSFKFGIYGAIAGLIGIAMGGALLKKLPCSPKL